MNKGKYNRITAFIMCVLLFLQCTPFHVYGQEIIADDNAYNNADIVEIVEDTTTENEAVKNEAVENEIVEKDVIDSRISEDDNSDDVALEESDIVIINETAADSGDAVITINDDGEPGTISGNYIYTSDTTIKNIPVIVHYAVTDENGYPFYEGKQDITVREEKELEWDFSFDRLSGKRTYKLVVYCESDRIGNEFGKKEAEFKPQDGDVDDNKFTVKARANANGKMCFTLDFASEVTDRTDVYFWIRNDFEKKYTPVVLNNVAFKSAKTTKELELSLDAYYGLDTYFDIITRGESVSSLVRFEPDSKYRVTFQNKIESKDALGYFDCFYYIDITYGARRYDHTVNAYYFKADEEPNRGHSFPSIVLKNSNEYKGIMGNGQNVKFEPDTKYYVEFEILASGKPVYRTMDSFTTDKFIEHSGSILSEPAMDSVTLNLSVPSGLEVDNKYFTHTRTADIYIAKKEEDFPSSPVTKTDLKYYNGDFTAEGILINRTREGAEIGLEEDTEYKVRAVFDGDNLIIADTQFKTLKEPREIVIEGTKVLYGGFNIDLTVHNPDGKLVEANDLYVSYRIKDTPVWLEVKKPTLVDKKKKLYRYSAPIDMQVNEPGTIVEYKACFSDRVKYTIDVGIVEGEITIPEDDREIKVYSEQTYIDAHAINMELTGMESYSSYVVLLARANGGDYARKSVWSLKDGSNRKMKVCVYTDRYKPGDEIDYILGYVDSRDDINNPAKIYNAKTGSFTVVPDNRGVEIFDSTAYTDSVILRGKITGDGRMMDYDYVKIFYKVNGEEIPYESQVVTVLPDQMAFDVELPELEDHTPYEYVIGIAKGSNAYIGELQNAYKGVITTQTSESRLVLKVSDVQPLNVVSAYNVAGNTVEILYSNVAKNANKLAFTTSEYMKGVRYKSTDTKVVTINSKGIMTVKGPGIAAITAKKGNLSGQFTIKVIDYKPMLVGKKISVVQGTTDVHNRLELIEQNGANITSVEVAGASGKLLVEKVGNNFEIKASGYASSKTEKVNLIVKSAKPGTISANSTDEGVRTDIFNMEIFVDVRIPSKAAFEISQSKIPNVFYCGSIAENAVFTFKSKFFTVEEIKAKSSKEMFQVKEYDKRTGKLLLTPVALNSATLKKYVNEEGEDLKHYYENVVPVTFEVKCAGHDPFEITQNVSIVFERPEITIDEAVIPASDREAIVSIHQGKKQLNAAEMRLRFDTASYHQDSVTKANMAASYDQVRVRISNDLSGIYYYNVSSYLWTDKVKASGKVKILLDTELMNLQTKVREKEVIVNTAEGFNTSATFNVYVVGNEHLKAKITPILEDERVSIVPTKNQGEFMVKGGKNAAGTINVKLDAAYKNSAIKGTTVKIKLVNKQPDVFLKRKGKLNIANRNESCVELVPKMLNMPKDVSISSNTLLTSTVVVDGEIVNDRCFKTEVVDGNIVVKAKPGYKMYSNRDYTLSMKVALSNGVVLNKDVVIRPINKMPKPKVTVISKNMYKTNREILGEYHLDIPEGFEISGIIVAKPSKTSIYNEEMTAKYDSATGNVTLQFKKYGARLSSAKKLHNVKCDITVKGADNQKPVRITLPVTIR